MGGIRSTDVPDARESWPVGLRLVRKPVAGPSRCRCGTRAPAGTAWWRVEGAPESIHAMVAEQSFCSTRCVRAYLLESLESLEALPPSRSPDMREVHSALLRLFAEIENAALRDALEAIDRPG